MAEDIAVFDLAAFRDGGPSVDRFAVALASACRNAGGFCIRNHGMGDTLMASVRRQAAAFFELEERIKNRVAVTAGQYGGYISPSCSAPLAAAAYEDSGRAGPCEAYRIHLELDRADPMVAAGVPLYGANVWPAEMPDFKPTVGDCFDTLCTISLDILRGLAIALQVDRETFVPYFENPLSTFALLCCTGGKVNAAGEARAVRPFRDSSAFTILLGDVNASAEMQRRDGTWIGGPVIEGSPAFEGALTVVIGNMMEAWSGGRLPSAQHRFAGHSRGASHPLAFSAIPNYGTVIRPLPGLGSNYRPVHVGPYMEALYQGQA